MRLRLRAAAAVVGGAVLIAACGGSGDGASGDTLQAQVASFDIAAGDRGRLIVGVLSPEQLFLVYGTVQLRFAYLGTGEAPVDPDYGEPVPARYLPIPMTTVPNPPPAEPRLVPASEARGVYAAEVGFDRAGFWEVEVSAVVDGRGRKGTSAFEVLGENLVPAPGDRALATVNHTISTPADVAPPAAVDSRFTTTGAIPDPEIHTQTIAGALAARRPVVAVFSTPVYCQSQFCGPVTDVVAELARQYGDRASFVHVEVWRDFPAQVLSKPAADWILHEKGLNEPWVFVVGADGVITDRFDNVATRGELEPILSALPVIGPAA